MPDSCLNNPCTDIAVLRERMSQIEKRQGQDIDELKTAIAQLTRAVNELTNQAHSWKGGWGMLVGLVSAMGGVGGVIGYFVGKGH